MGVTWRTTYDIITASGSDFFFQLEQVDGPFVELRHAADRLAMQAVKFIELFQIIHVGSGLTLHTVEFLEPSAKAEFLESYRKEWGS